MINLLPTFGEMPRNRGQCSQDTDFERPGGLSRCIGQKFTELSSSVHFKSRLLEIFSTDNNSATHRSRSAFHRMVVWRTCLLSALPGYLVRLLG